MTPLGWPLLVLFVLFLQAATHILLAQMSTLSLYRCLACDPPGSHCVVPVGPAWFGRRSVGFVVFVGWQIGAVLQQ